MFTFPIWTNCIHCFAAGDRPRSSHRPPTPDPSYGMETAEPPSPGPIVTNAWIWFDQPDKPGEVFFRRRFDLSEKPAAATLYFACDDSAAAWVNGEPLDEGKQFAGTREMKRIEVGPLLRAGRNLLAFRATNRCGPAGLLAVLVWTDRQDRRHRIETDMRWRATRQAEPGWNRPEFDDSDWATAQAVAYPPSPPWGAPKGYPGKLPPSDLETLRLEPVRIVSVEPGGGRIERPENLLKRDGRRVVFVPARESDGKGKPFVILDFGREIAGGVTVYGTGAGGGRALFHVQVGESYSEVTHPAVNAHGWYETTATLGADKPIRIAGTAFRFCKLTLLESEGPAEVDAVVGDFRYYPVSYRGGFACSDPLLTRIWWTAAYTVHLCMQDGIWDAPKRDRMEWMGDVHPQARVIYYAFGDTNLLKKTLTRLRGPIEMSAEINGIPAYTMWWVITLRDLYDFTGDRSYLESMHERLVAACEWIAGDLDERGLFAARHGGWTFLDWGHLSGEDCLAGTHMLAVKALADGACLCRALGDGANARRFERVAEAARRAALEHLLDPETGCFTTRKQINALAVFSGVARGETAQRINREVLARGDDQLITPYYNYYVLLARADARDHQGALDLIRRYWGAMLEAGATTFWEVFDERWLTRPSGIEGPGPESAPDTHANLDALAYRGYRISLCHGWSAGPAAWLSAEVLGVKPKKPGFDEVEVLPHLCDLRWAEGRVPTPHGTIRVRHEVSGDRFRSEISLPEKTRAVFGVPKRAGVKMRIEIDGRPVRPAKEDGDFAYLRLEGGRTLRIETFFEGTKR